jgi:DUF1680 family protein
MSLHETAFASLPLGTIKPTGWLKDQLRIQADGLTGHLEEHWADVGPHNGWIGGKGESWERGPYYLDGLLPLAYLLQDEKLIAKAGRWIEWALASQQDSGMFGPERIESVNNDVNKEQDWWHYMIMLKVFIQYEEATNDPRVIPFMSRFLTYVDRVIEDQPLDGWAQARGAELLLAIVWLYKKTGDAYLLPLADTVTRQTTDWTDIFNDFPFIRKVEHWDFRTHVVNVAMAIKTPGILYELTGDEKQREAVRKGIASLMTHHGQAHGMFSGDEWLSGTHPSQGVELCAVVEYMFSMENLVRILGEGQYGDILEKVAFNALPATISADWTSHQYDQQVNQVVCNVANRNWSNGDEANLFGLEPNFGCCTANMHQGWPKLASHLWMSDNSGGLAAISYAPCIVETVVGSDAKATIEVGGDYPFLDEVQMTLSIDRAERFAISFRIPAWCNAPELLINGEIVSLHVVNGFAKVIREWNQESLITLKLPMEVRTKSRNLFAVNVERGPLVYVLPIGESWQQLLKREKFHDWEIYPTTAWKFGLVSEAGFEVTFGDIPRQPFDAMQAPVRLRTKGQLIRNWRMEGNNADSPPINPDTKGQPIVDLELVPYGSARLRIGEFPLIGKR